VVAVEGTVVVTVAPAGRHSDIPGNSGDVALAPFAENSEFIDTATFFEIDHHESPDTTVYIEAQFVGAAAAGAAGLGTAADNAGNKTPTATSATDRRRRVRGSEDRPTCPARPRPSSSRRRSGLDSGRSRHLARRSPRDHVMPVPEGDGSAPVRSFMSFWYRCRARRP
jgi:hypothetical protein